MKISVIGCGYLGAVHAAAMASIGHDVVGIDVDERRIAQLSAGRSPIHEPGLDPLLREGVDSGRLRFSTDPAALADAQLHFIAVGTPQLVNSNAADLRYVESAIDVVAAHGRDDSVVVGKSTVPVGTAAAMTARLRAAGRPIVLTWNPEFLREGYAVQDTLTPDRLVYGIPAGEGGERARALLDEVYRPAIEAETPVVVTDLATAELVKVAANAFLATKISFINAMAEIAEAADADVTQLADAIGYDTRIGRRFLNAGVGFGGGCLPKDIRAFQARAEELGRGEALGFLREVDAVNLRRRDRLVEIVGEQIGGLHRKRVVVLGLAFKPDSDDVRDSPSLDIAVRLKGLGADVVATDPAAIETSRALHPQLDYEPDLDTALRGADAVVLVTEWPQYRELDPAHVASLVAARVIIDGRNVLDAEAWRAAGFDYRGFGRR